MADPRMGKNSASPTDDKTFPFMRLPGELRNRVYRHILADSPPTNLILSLIRSVDRRASFAENHPRRPYLGLTQVSRTTRAEFAPLYAKVRKPSIPLRLAAQWLAMFPLADRVAARGAYAALVALYEPPLPPAPGVDIIPLLSIDWSNQAFNLSLPGKYHVCRPRPPPEIDIMVQLLHARPDYRYLLNTDIIAVGITVEWRRVVLRGFDKPVYSKNVVFTLILAPSLNGTGNLEAEKVVVGKFVRDTGLDLHPRHCDINVRCKAGRWLLSWDNVLSSERVFVDIAEAR